MNSETATLAGGCFWCTEAIFQRLKGVNQVLPGYAGGWVENPTYDQVCSGKTGHAEAVQITFDPSIISYKQLLEVFFRLHDPTSLNQQGADIGPHYRSSIFFHDEKQKKTAEKVREDMDTSHIFGKKIVTEIISFTSFYKAESYHENYYNKNQDAPYCRAVIDPKIQKLMKEFSKDVKS